MATSPVASTSSSPTTSLAGGGNGSGGKAAATKKRKNFFSPSLKLQRQAFCLEQLRIHGIRSVLELGCGEGDLLATLCEPASHRDEFPPYVQPTNKSKLNELKRSIPKTPVNERELHVDRLAGIDISADRIKQAREATKPPVIDPNEDLETSFGRRERWEPLRVDLWQGSFAYYEETLDGFEAVVASEVIEHLHNDTLVRFGPIVLGRYRPRIVIVTTPNYDFHPLFPASAEGQLPNKNRTTDPTGRTNRIFRDDDHKFEFTSDEFQHWANELADTFDYTVTFSGVGSARAYTRDPEADAALCATQCAVFQRVYANEAERAPRSPRTSPLAFLNSQTPALAPILRCTHIYPVDLPSEPDITPWVSTQARLNSLIAKSFYYDQTDVRLRDLWGGSAALRKAAGGQIGVVFDAVASAPSSGGHRWRLEVRPGGPEEGEPLQYAEESVWIVRVNGSRGSSEGSMSTLTSTSTTTASGSTGLSPTTLKKKTKKKKDEVYEPVGGWTRGSVNGGSWTAMRAVKKDEVSDTESSDAYRRRGRPDTSSSEEWD